MNEISFHKCAWCERRKEYGREYIEYDAGGHKYAEWVCKECFDIE